MCWPGGGSSEMCLKLNMDLSGFAGELVHAVPAVSDWGLKIGEPNVNRGAVDGRRVL